MSDQGYIPGLDKELDLKAIVRFGIGLAVVVVFTAAAMWGMTLFLRGLEEAQDPPPPLLPEAREPYSPPAPNLQTDPIGNIVELREWESDLLGSYGWVDEEQGIARLPIERAIELVVAGELDAPGVNAPARPETAATAADPEDAP